MDLTSWTELGLAQVIGWSITGMVLAAAAVVTFSGQHRNPRQDRHLTWWLFHWFTGGHLESGRSPRYEDPRRARHKLRRAGLAAVRTAATAGLVVFVYVDSGAPDGTGMSTLAAWGLGTSFGLALFAVVVAWVAVRVAHYLRWVYPLHMAVCLAAGYGNTAGEGKEIERAINVRAWRYITVRRDLERGGDGVVVICSPTFAPRKANKGAVEEIIRAKLELGDDVTHRWEMKGRHHFIRFWPKDPIRDVAPFTDDEVQKLVETQSTSSTFVLGVTRGDQAYKVNLDRESPHVLMSAGTGGGKSTMLTVVAAQLMWHGAEPWVADYKRHSLRWLRDLPGVRYARDIGEIHRMLIELAAEGDRRNRAWDHVGINDEGPDFRRIVLILEELSTTAGLLRDHWTDVRESGDPATSPAIRALTAILNMGRAVKINVLAVAQRASANAVGSGDLRENFSVRILAEHTPQTWKMLTSADFVPKSKIKGRVQVCVGDNATEVQVIRMTEEQAQDWVADKRGMQPMTHVPHLGENASPGETVRERPAYGTPDLPAGLEPVSIWQASKDNGKKIVDLNYEALKKARDRDREKGEFPEAIDQRGDTPLYDPRDLQRWELNRPRPKAEPTDEVGRLEDRENESSAEQVPQGEWLQGQPSRRDSDRERFEAMVDRSDPDGCHPWTGSVNGDGYPYFWVDGQSVPAHRFAYEDQVGPIPEGYTIDHLIGPGEPCTSKRCQNGAHLEAVPNEVNVARRHERDRAQQGAATA